jgi:hypothetical protein
MYAYNGIVYLAVGSGPTYVPGVWAVDVPKNKIKNRIELIWNREAEGIAIYNEKLYVSQRDGLDTSGVNPCRIYQITF